MSMSSNNGEKITKDTEKEQRARLFPCESGSCPKGCNVVLWKRSTRGIEIIYDVCPMCFYKTLGDISTTEATRQIELLLHNFKELSFRCRETRRLESELEFLKADIQSGHCTVDSYEFEPVLVKAMKAVHDNLKADEDTASAAEMVPKSCLEQLHSFQVSMVDLEENIRQKKGATSAHALVGALAQLEQVHEDVRSAESLGTSQEEFQAFQKEVEELEADLRLVQRTIAANEHLWPSISLSDNVGVLKSRFAALVAKLKTKHDEAKMAALQDLTTKQVRRMDLFQGHMTQCQASAEVDAMRQQFDEFASSTRTRRAVATCSIPTATAVGYAVNGTDMGASNVATETMRAEREETCEDVVVPPENVLPLTSTTPASASLNDDSCSYAALEKSVRQNSADCHVASDKQTKGRYKAVHGARLDTDDVSTARVRLNSTTQMSDVITIMREYQDDVYIQALGCRKLSYLASLSTSNRDAIARSGGLELVFGALQGVNRNIAAIQESGLLALVNLSRGNTRTKVIEAGAIYLVMDALGEYTKDVGIQTNCLLALCNFASDSENRAVIGSLGGVRRALKAIKLHSNERFIQQYGLYVIGLLVLGNAENAAMVRSSGGIPIILVALRAHPKDVDIQRRGLLAIGNLASDTTARSMVIRLRGTELVLDALRCHQSVASVQKRGLLALGNLAYDVKYKTMIGCRLGGIHVAAAALEEHPSAVDVQQFGLRTLGCLSSGNDENCSTMITAGCVPIAVRALALHPNVDNVQRNALIVLCDLASDNSGTTASIVKAGGVRLVVTALKMHRGNQDIQKNALCLLGKLVGVDAGLQAMVVRAGGTELVLDALLSHPDQEGIQANGLFALFPLVRGGRRRDKMIDLALTGIRRFPDNAEIQTWGCRVLTQLANDSSSARRRLQKLGVLELVEAAAEEHPSDLELYASLLQFGKSPSF